MALPLVLAGAAAAGAALWKAGEIGVDWASDYVRTPPPLTLPRNLPTPAAPTPDQLRRGATWTPEDMIERTRQSTKNFWDGYQAGARMSSTQSAAAAAGSAGDTGLYVLAGLAVLGGVLLITR